MLSAVLLLPRLRAGDAHEGAVSPGRWERYFLVPAGHKRGRDTSDLAEGDGWGRRQHSDLQYHQWPKDSKGLRQPRELRRQRAADFGHLPSQGHPAR